MKRSLLFIALVLLLAVFSAVLFRQEQPSETALTLNGQSLTLEVMRTPEEVERGLSGREYLPLDHGMLFLFEKAERYPFWMKDMSFPLDIIFLRDGRVVEMVTLPTPMEGEVPVSYTPSFAVNQVLEVNAGQAKAYGLEIGTYVEEFDNLGKVE